MNLRLFSLLVPVAVSLLGGCAKQAEGEYANPTAFAATEYDRVFDAAVAELRDRAFSVDRRDPNAGVVTTRPKPAPSALEPWRAEDTRGYAAQSTFNNDRRIVTVQVTRGPESMPTLGVEVRVERRQAPPQSLTSTVMAPPRLAGKGRQRSERSIRTESGVEAPHWKPIGRDTVMEGRLIEAILNRASAARDAAS